MEDTHCIDSNRRDVLVDGLQQREHNSRYEKKAHEEECPPACPPLHNILLRELHPHDEGEVSERDDDCPDENMPELDTEAIVLEVADEYYDGESAGYPAYI